MRTFKFVFSRRTSIRIISVSVVSLLVGLFVSLVIGGQAYLYGQDKSGFPEGYDAMEKAPGSHKIIFENGLVRVLEVTVPPAGTTIPLHHHRWPSFFLDWDTGGGSPHIRYHRADGSVRDVPAIDEPRHAGQWNVGWMEPEPLHAIEVVDEAKSAEPVSGAPGSLRIEIKCRR